MSTKPVTIRFENGFDWELLCAQKQQLLNVIFEDMGGKITDAPHTLDGLIEIIDEIQDQAAELGEPVVYATDDGFDYDDDASEMIVEMLLEDDEDEEQADEQKEDNTGI